MMPLSCNNYPPATTMWCVYFMSCAILSSDYVIPLDQIYSASIMGYEGTSHGRHFGAKFCSILCCVGTEQ